MVYSQTKNPNLGKFLEGLAMEDVGIFYGHLVNSQVIWYFLWPFGIFYGHLVNSQVIWDIFMAIWYILGPFGIFFPVLVYFPCFGSLYQEKSGNPVCPSLAPCPNLQICKFLAQRKT
jgi:hypothetical protein